MTRLVPYIRVSRVNGRDTDTATSAPDQRRAIEQFAALRKFELAEAIEDLDVSGGRYDDRQGLQEALRQIETGEVDGIIVARLDRFSRSLINGLRGLQRIDAASGDFISVAENFDTTTPMGRAMLQISLVFAELERSRIGENWEMQKRDAIDAGAYLGRHVPFGYTRVNKRLLIDTEQAETVRVAFHERAANRSWPALAALLNEIAPERSWTPSNVRNMIANRAYLGESNHGHLTNVAAHEAIVSRVEWEAAQSKQSRVFRAQGSLLGGGTLICSGCGRPMSHSTVNRGTKMYVCQRQSVDGRCPKPVQITTARVDEYVTTVFREWVAKQGIAVDAQARENDAEDALRRVELAESEMTAYRDANMISIMGKVAYTDGLRHRADAVDEARRALQAQVATSAPVHGFSLTNDWETIPLEIRHDAIAAEMRITVLSTTPGSRAPVADRLAIDWLAESEDEVGVLAAQPR